MIELILGAVYYIVCIASVVIIRLGVKRDNEFCNIVLCFCIAHSASVLVTYITEGLLGLN